jgi:hypothetical protein
MPVKKGNPILAAKLAAERKRSLKIADGVWEQYIQAKRDMKHKRNEYRWTEGTVDTKKEHIGIWYRNLTEPLAYVAPKTKKNIIVQFFISPDDNNKAKRILYDICKELDFYLVEHGPTSIFEDAWEYAKYHCGTSANVYSNVHWNYFPKLGKSQK